MGWFAWRVNGEGGKWVGGQGWDQRLWKWVVGLNVVQVQANAPGNSVGINDVFKAEYATQNNRVSKSHWEALQSSSQSPIFLARRLDGESWG